MITHNVRTYSHNTPKHASAKQIDFTPEKLLSLRGKGKRQIQKRNYIDSTRFFVCEKILKSHFYKKKVMLDL
jgi:hypothetical protein